MAVPGPFSAHSALARSPLRGTTGNNATLDVPYSRYTEFVNWDDSVITHISPLGQTDWKNAETPIEAMKQFFEGVREGGKHLPPLQLSLDSRDNNEEQDSTLISFYKERRDKSPWAAPFNCRILGVGLHKKKHIHEKF